MPSIWSDNNVTFKLKFLCFNVDLLRYWSDYRCFRFWNIFLLKSYLLTSVYMFLRTLNKENKNLWSWIFNCATFEHLTLTCLWSHWPQNYCVYFFHLSIICSNKFKFIAVPRSVSDAFMNPTFVHKQLPLYLLNPP